MARFLAALVVLWLAAGPARAADVPGLGGMYAPGGAPLRMLDSKIDVTVRGPLAEVTIVQRFQNPTDRPTEATYIFPLPADAAVFAMSIQVGTRTIHAAIERRAEAQRRYEDAVRAGVGAAVLDQERPDIFTQTVAAVPAKGAVEVTLRFDTLAWYRSGTWELVLPLVVAPRYVPGTATARPTTGTGRGLDTQRAPDASRVTPHAAPGAGGQTAIAIAFQDAVTDITSPTHELAVRGTTATAIDPKSDHDAVIRWRSTAPADGWVEPAPGGGGFAAALVEAPVPAAAKRALRWTLVLDRSAASRGDAEAVARPLVRALFGASAAADRIAVIGSDQIASSAPADAARAIEAAWGSSPGAFDLTAVLAAARPNGAPLVLVSGGLVADDAAAVAAAVALRVPVHVIGVGPAPARGLLGQLATATGGTLRFAVPGDDVAALAAQLRADLASPPAPLTVSWGTLGASAIVPGTLPRLGAGQATLVLARVAHVRAANARAHGELIALDVVPAVRDVTGATAKLGPLARRWARARLEELLAGKASAAAVTAHALQYGLVSPYTSMVAIGTEVVVEGGVKRSVAVPVSVPAGMRWQAVKEETTVDLSQPIAGTPSVTRDADEESEERLVTGSTSMDDAERSPRSMTTAGETLAVSTTSIASWRRRLTIGAGGGYLRTAGRGGALFALTGRYEFGGATMFGLDASLWLADDADVQGRLLAAVSLRSLARFVELGAGLGIQLGDGTGPAGSLALRFRLPPRPRAALYLRYDAALLLDGEDRGQHGVTLGVELGF